MKKVPRQRKVVKVKFLMMDKIIPDSLKLLNYRIDFWLISMTHFYDSSYLFIRDYAGWVMNYDNIKTTIIYSLTFARGQVKNQLKRLKPKQLKLTNWRLLTRTDNELISKLELMQRERKMDLVRASRMVRFGPDRSNRSVAPSWRIKVEPLSVQRQLQIWIHTQQQQWWLKLKQKQN